MKNFRQFNEDAESKLSGMDDSQIEDLKKNNPGAASKIDQIRKNRAKKTPSAPAPSSAPKLKTSAIVKPTAIVKSGIKDTAKKVAGDAAKKGSMAAAKKGMDLVRQKQRQSDAGKWSQGIKNAPKSGSALAKTSSSSGSGLAKTGKTQAEKEGPGRKGTYRGEGQAKGPGPDTAYSGGAYPKERKPSADHTAAKARAQSAAREAAKAKMKEKKDAAKKAEDELTRKQSQRDNGIVGSIKSSLGGDRFTKDKPGDTEATKKAKEDKRQAASKRIGDRVGGAIKSTPGKIGNAIKGLGRAAARTKTSNLQGIEGGDSMEALQKNSY